MHSDKPAAGCDSSPAEGDADVSSSLARQDPGSVLVLDTSAFFLSVAFSGLLCTVPRVEGELKDLRGKARFAVFLDEGMEILQPAKDSRKKAEEASRRSGDAPVLSQTDLDLLALAVERGGTLVTDDFAIQNTAHLLNIPVRSLIQRDAQARVWKIRCTGCGKYYDEMPTRAGDCPVCGSLLKRKHK